VQNGSKGKSEGRSVKRRDNTQHTASSKQISLKAQNTSLQYSVLTRSHIESVVARLLCAKVWGSRFGGAAEKCIGRKVNGLAYLQ
jgi:hypothetical protein